MAETQKWMFIGEIPLLYEARRVARQLQIEIWLDPPHMLRALNLKLIPREKLSKQKYVI